MAKKKVIAGRPDYRCRDCGNSYDYFNINYRGEPIMCRCRKSEWSKLLSERACDDNFVLKDKEDVD